MCLRTCAKLPKKKQESNMFKINISILITKSIAALLIYIALQQSPIVTCNRRQEEPSRLIGSQIDGAAGYVKANEPENNVNKDNFECEVFADYGKNYLTPIDVVVKNSEDNIACIKAQFALSIKVEEAFTLSAKTVQTETNGTQPGGNDIVRSILGYLPLEHVLSVEDSCPTKKNIKEKQSANANKTSEDEDKSKNNTDDEIDELEMIVTFECGKLSFTFRRDATRIFVTSIKGIVKLDKKVVREFISNKPIFLTNDLDHHFKYDDIIEVTSEAPSKTYILTANFYFTEIEAFRNTTSRDFIQPPDESSQPFSDEVYASKEKTKQDTDSTISPPIETSTSITTSKQPPPPSTPPEANT